ncbi:hypothetical protein SAMN02745165_01524 [Malonomonas rubra DSM 5091]|uniref:PH domain-containing protein n=1 Tax=Malonomonas rubra DSM 5091 TaxID=1122189 RepID=A0A1M6GEU8_MALRU|nr:hypothetical protein [Malonomonas rubra]SHJ08448.1 hypothetical protein SAMN02745165_01524 [Malonomonas rubra DSM 5091]
METQSFSIRKSFLLPLGLVVLLTLTLLVCCILLQVPLAKTLILAAFTIPVIALFIESSLRRVTIDEKGVQIDKPLRSKRIDYGELTAVDTVLVRKRAFISLSSEADFIIISNGYADFGRLVNLLLERSPEKTISDETRQMANNPPEKSSDVFSAWIAVAVLVLIIYVQLRGAF